ncbi:MAG: radical SAM protein [Planctomycetes bacterium]|nr:radical SAM protein [Planctomycetota bacterium]
MGNGTYHINDNLYLVRGPVNAALYDVKQGDVYTVSPLITEVLGSGLGSSRAYGPQPISKDTLGVIRGYLSRHPALAELSDRWRGNGLSREAPQEFFAPTGTDGLDHIWLELTESCNLSCTHCYAEAGACSPDELSQEQWKQILAEGARLGAKTVQFTGGEPTLHPGLTDLIEYARAQRYTDIEVFTNGTRLEDGILKRWKSLGVDVALSFYSYDPETHDRITGRPRSFRQTVQGIRAILSHKIPVRVAIILMKENLSHHKGTIDFLRGLGLKAEEIEWDTVRPTGRGAVVEALPEGEIGTDTTSFRPSSSLEEGQGTCCDKKFGLSTCWKGLMAISSRGDAYPCIFARQRPVGKFPEMGLEEIIRGQELQRLWQITLEDVEMCKDCELRYGCFDCRALALTTTGELLSKGPRCRYNPYTGLMENNGAKIVEEKPKRRTDIINEDVEDETVIYDPKSHNVHHLNPIAGVIWVLCDGNHTTKQITEEIVAVLDAEPSQVERDVTKIIEDFQGKDLLDKTSK